jgi:hypothetical protein
MGAPIRPADRPAVEDALTAARTAMGSLPFEAAWDVGRGLPVEQIVAWVVAGSYTNATVEFTTVARGAPAGSSVAPL